ncbi:MAG TPA: hypothetical protein DGG95_13420 [Cytophagales bacterium]|jgi:hypothetical protein|nr:hypothetical protein [Cytophagales bacterium]
MAKGRKLTPEEEFLWALKNDPKRIYGANVDPVMLQDIPELDDEGGETKWPKKTMPQSKSVTKEPQQAKGRALFENLRNRFKERRGGGRTAPVTSDTGGTAPIETRKMPDTAILKTGDLPAIQQTYQYVKDYEQKPTFQFDDFYKPDTEGYRDFGGYLGDLSKFTLGAFGATEPIDVYTPSADFNTMISESRMRRDQGLDPETRSMYQNMADRAYNYDVKNIRNLSGGSSGTALANLGGASDRYYTAQNEIASLDEQFKQKNRDSFYSAAMAGENVHRRIFEDKLNLDMMNKSAAGALMSDSMDNIVHRKEYEDTYKKPGSPYYEYMKELTLDTRMNRELKQFGEEQRVRDANQFLLDVENQMQEKEEGINRINTQIKQDFANQLNEQGMAPVIESAEDFKNYNGGPVVDINNPITPEKQEEQKMLSDLRSKETFGLTETEMETMTDDQLLEMGIERKPNERGTMQYSITKPMDMPPGEKREDDPELANQIDVVSREYSQKKKALMDEWYLKDEKKYNKLLKELEAEEAEKKQLVKDEYLKKAE